MIRDPIIPIEEEIGTITKDFFKAMFPFFSRFKETSEYK